MCAYNHLNSFKRTFTETRAPRTASRAERVRPVQGEHGFPVPLRQALDALHLIDDQAAPAHACEGRVAPEKQLVGRDAHVEAVGLGPALRTQSTRPQASSHTSPPGIRVWARSQVFTTELMNLSPPTVTVLVLLINFFLLRRDGLSACFHGLFL